MDETNLKIYNINATINLKYKLYAEINLKYINIYV